MFPPTLAMSNFPVGWVKLAQSQLLAIDLVNAIIPYSYLFAKKNNVGRA
jgi:hypothetical protein